MRRSVLRRSLGALAGTPVVVGSASGASGTASAAPTDGPSGVHVAYGPDPTTTLRVGWTGPPAPSAAVEYGREGPDRRVPATAMPVPGLSTVAYTAELTGLAPGTIYEYQAVVDGQ